MSTATPEGIKLHPTVDKMIRSFSELTDDGVGGPELVPRARAAFEKHADDWNDTFGSMAVHDGLPPVRWLAR